MIQPLEGYAVLVTRPAEQAGALIREIGQLGGQVLFAPMIEVQALTTPAIQEVLQRLDEYQMVIFISKNAAEFGLKRIKEARRMFSTQNVFAVGIGTATRLCELGINEVHTPQSEFSSEGLLKLAGLSARAINGKRALIIRGVGGRELLAQVLHRRGAQVDYCEVYARTVPSFRLGDVLNASKRVAPDIAVISSAEALANLAEKIEQEGLTHLYDVPLMVAGERTAAEVERLGFTQGPIIIDNPGDRSTVEALVRWVSNEQ